MHLTPYTLHLAPYTLHLTLVRQGVHTEWRQPSRRGVWPDLLQEGQGVSRLQGEVGLAMRGSTPDISVTLQVTTHTGTFYRLDRPSCAGRCLSCKLSTVHL